MGNLMTPTQVINRLGRSKTFVYGLIHSNVLKTVDIAGKKFVDEDSLNELLETQRQITELKNKVRIKPKDMQKK